MRIDFSEPECSNCFHCRILNTQESEPSNVIASSVNTMPVNSEPVQALEHASAAVGSTSASTSSPVQALGHDDSAATGSFSTFSFGPQIPSAPPVITSLFSESVQTLPPKRLFSDVFGSPFQTTSGSDTSATSTSSTSSLFQSSSSNRFLVAPPITSVSSALTLASGQITYLFAARTQPTLGSTQATFGSGTSTSSGSLFGPMQNPAWTTGGALPATFSSNLFRPNPSTSTEVFGAKPWSVSLPVQDYPRTGVNLFGQNRPIPPTGSYPGFPAGSNPNPFVQSQNTSGGGSIFASPKTLTPQPYGYNSPTIPLSPFSNQFNNSEQRSMYPGYAPTPDGGVTCGIITSISASMPHQPKSHEELRWEDYKRGDKGSRTNTVFGSPPIFASPSVPVHPQRPTFGTPQETLTGIAFSFSQHNPALTGFGTHSSPISSSVHLYNAALTGFGTHSSPISSSVHLYNAALTGFGTHSSTISSNVHPYNAALTGFGTHSSPISSSVQRPHETAAVSFPASRCTACGATTSTSASAYSYFNSAALAPPSAAPTYVPRHFFPTYGYGPMMFGTSPAAQVTTPSFQAYPFNGYTDQYFD